MERVAEPDSDRGNVHRALVDEFALVEAGGDGPVHPLDFQRGIERFSERIVEALTGQYLWAFPLAG
jgi:hypothetical protein